MKKFIKINLIILVIFCLSFELTLFRVFGAENQEDEETNQEEEYQEILDDQEGDPEDYEDENTKRERDMDALQLEKSELEGALDSSNSQMIFLENELSETVAEIAEINQSINDKKMEIETLEAQEEDLLVYIAKAEDELEKSNKKYSKQKKLLEKRLVSMYEVGQVSYLSLLLSSNGIFEFMSNYYLLQEIANADTDLLQSVQAEQKYNKKLAKALETKKLILEVSKDTREKNAIALENMLIIKNSKISQLSEEELALEKAIEEYQNQITAIETEIRLLAIANIGNQYVGGTMAWPVPGYTRISSQFGMRTHPITGVYKLHTGVDISAPRNSTFIAANDGVVTYAGVNRAYGNMVIIDHGGGITTLYAHGESILVSVGDIVTQGTPVLAVGSTGYSTGPHAHFEVRINGEYVQPLDYITSYNSEVKEKEDKNKVSNNTNTSNTVSNNTSSNTAEDNNTVKEEKTKKED